MKIHLLDHAVKRVTIILYTNDYPDYFGFSFGRLLVIAYLAEIDSDGIFYTLSVRIQYRLAGCFCNSG